MAIGNAQRLRVIEGAMAVSYKSISATETLLNTDGVVEITSGTFTLFLPTAVGLTSKRFVLVNSGAGVITVDGAGTETIGGNLTEVVLAGDTLEIVSNGTNWLIITSLLPSLIAFKQIFATETLAATDENVEITSGTFSLFLPTAVGLTGKRYTLVNSGGGIITVDADGTETINGNLTEVLIAGDSLEVISNNGNWLIISSLFPLPIQFKAITGTETLVVTDQIVEITANTFSLFLPTAVGITGHRYTLINSGSGIVTVDADGTETINGALTKVLIPGDSMEILSNNANWLIVSLPVVAIKAIIGTETLDPTDELVEITSGTFSLFLPTAVGLDAKGYSLINSGSGTITVDADGTETINGNLTEVMLPGDSLIIVSNGANWLIASSLLGPAIEYKAITTTETLATTDQYVEITANTFTLDLPTAVGLTGHRYTLFNSGSGIVTVDAATTETIDGSLTYTLLAGAKLEIVSNNVDWLIATSETPIQYKSISGAETLAVTDRIVEITAGTFTLTLPTAVGITGHRYVLVNVGTGIVTMDGDGTETVGGATTHEIIAGDTLEIVSNNVNWLIVSSLLPTDLAYKAISGTETLAIGDEIVEVTANSFSLFLPPAADVPVGKSYKIVNTGAGTVTLDGDAAETINGATTEDVLTTESREIRSTGSNWLIV